MNDLTPKKPSLIFSEKLALKDGVEATGATTTGTAITSGSNVSASPLIDFKATSSGSESFIQCIRWS